MKKRIAGLQAMGWITAAGVLLIVLGASRPGPSAPADAGSVFEGPVNSAVVVAEGDYDQAAGAAVVAGALDAPVLTLRPGGLDELRKTLDQLAVPRIVVMGDEGGVSAETFGALEARYPDVLRIHGPTAAKTAAAAAVHAHALAGSGSLGGKTTVFIAARDDPAARITTAPASYRYHIPVLLSSPDGLPAASVAALRWLQPEQAVIVGGTDRVDAEVANQIRDLGIYTDRMSGSGPAETAAHVADLVVNQGGFSAAQVMLADTRALGAALAATPDAAYAGSPILLTGRGPRLAYATQQWLTEQHQRVESVHPLGADSAPTLADAAAAAAETPARTYTYEVGAFGAIKSDFTTFAEHASWSLTDPRGWSLGHDLRFTEVSEGGDFRLWLASPEAVAAAAPGCGQRWSCRVGDSVYINDDRWSKATPSYRGHTLDAYRHYVVIHEVGHWLGLRHVPCPEVGGPAPVMQQQSIGLQGCTASVWPSPNELEAVRNRHIP